MKLSGNFHSVNFHWISYFTWLCKDLLNYQRISKSLQTTASFYYCSITTAYFLILGKAANYDEKIFHPFLKMSFISSKAASFLNLMQIFVLCFSFFEFFIPLPPVVASRDVLPVLRYVSWHAKYECFQPPCVHKKLVFYEKKKQPLKTFDVSVYRDRQSNFKAFVHCKFQKMQVPISLWNIE